MNICYGTTGWASLFTICEHAMLLGIGIFFTKSTYQIIKNKELNKFEFLDWIIIYLSIAQIYLLILSLLFNLFLGMSIILDVLKFSQNAVVGGVLLYQIL